MFENALIIVTGFPHQLKEFGWVDPDLLEKGAMISAFRTMGMIGR